MIKQIVFKTLFFFGLISSLSAQHSVARQWNEVLLEAIRNDYARPTVHARNLFHVSIAMYDSWAVYQESAETYFLGKTVNGFAVPFEGLSIDVSSNQDSLIQTTLSFATYRVLKHRFDGSPGETETFSLIEDLMVDSLGYDVANQSIDYENGGAVELGNYIADQMISYGLQDLSNEQNEYVNIYYSPVNTALVPEEPGNSTITDMDRWQPLTLEFFKDQSGNIIPTNTPDFLSPEWGKVRPFALPSNELKVNSSNGYDYWVYYDPSTPPSIDELPDSVWNNYKWGFSLVSAWSSHLDTANPEVIDISPQSIGNIDDADYPTNFDDYDQFYDWENGGDISKGHTVNPSTGLPYTPQMIKRADYGRVLAEFWADGPDSETPPGHWYTLLNYVSDHDSTVKKFNGQGEVLGDLEWDIKAYFILGGALHDAAITAWGIKGWYDYVRPISSLRAMAENGQCTSDTLPRYHVKGIPLKEGYIELVDSNDALIGTNYENINKIKLYAWKGPDYIANEETDEAGVDWILADNWWPYQRPSFVTPPFAGYISGHSTFSRAAAEVLTSVTGDSFFPGGMGEFEAKKNEFLVFEDGPSEDVVLQWATYKDASDQCSLSRIWGGIHPPADDIPGRLIGKKIGQEAFNFALPYFNGTVTALEQDYTTSLVSLNPQPVRHGDNIEITSPIAILHIGLVSTNGKIIKSIEGKGSTTIQCSTVGVSPGLYLMKIQTSDRVITRKVVVY